jgi:hypothetical protein
MKKKAKKKKIVKVKRENCHFCEEDFDDVESLCNCRKCGKPICETHRSTSEYASGFNPEYNCINCED